MNIEYAVLSKDGGRKQNEDFVNALVKDTKALFALADGLGGHGKGEVASKLACETVINLFKAADMNGEELLKECFISAQREVMAEQIAQGKTSQMKTTLVLLNIDNGVARWGHIGDSRLYMFRNNDVFFQTKDHSVPQMLATLGEIEEKDIRNHEDRNRILKVIGVEWDDGKAKYELSKENMKLEDGDTFLLATDGFWELIDEDTMLEMYKSKKSLDKWIDNMEKEVLKNGKDKNMDNYSAIVVRYSERGGRILKSIFS